jgi:tetratricopeptide (TPR) repeat protein
MDKPISIQDVNGNVTVTIIEGNNNKTELSIGSFVEKVTRDCGLQLIYEDNFKNDSNTSTNFGDWLDGFSFNIKSVYHGREFRRNQLLNNIKQQLESKGRLLILGESGTSKSVILMEILCDFIKKGYKAFHNLDLGSSGEIKNLKYIENSITELVDNGNNILIMVDNIHNKTNANIFTLIKKLRDDNEDKLDKIKFLLAARQPEFGWAMDRGIYDSETIEKIDMLFDNQKKYNLAYFSQEEVKGFLEKYKKYQIKKRNKSLEQHAQEIFKYTNGHPIMVRFAVLQNGLENHVKKMYADYLVENKSPNVERIKSVIACSLYDISSVPLTDSELSDKLALKNPTLQIMNTIIKKEGNIWTTIHPIWDLVLFKYMFSRNEADLESMKEAFNQVFMKIMDIQVGSSNQIIILNTLYNTIGVRKFIDLRLIQDMIKLEIVERKLDKKNKMILFTEVLGIAYDKLKDYYRAIECYDEAIRINPKYVSAYVNKGAALSALGKKDKAIECYDEAIKLTPEEAGLFYNKGNALTGLGKKDKAIECYDEAIRLNPSYDDAYYNKGLALLECEQNERAVECFDVAIRLKPQQTDAYYNKGYALSALGELENAIECYDKIIEIDNNNIQGLVQKAYVLIKLNRKAEAKLLIDKVRSIEPNDEVVTEFQKSFR